MSFALDWSARTSWFSFGLGCSAGTSPFSFTQPSYPSGYFSTRYRISFRILAPQSVTGQDVYSWLLIVLHVSKSEITRIESRGNSIETPAVDGYHIL